MTVRPRYIRAEVVDFGALEFAGDFGAAKPKSSKDKKIRQLLKKAARLKKRIRHLKIRQPLGWKGAVKSASKNLKVVMSDLKALGWKPKKPTRATKPGEDETDAMLDDIPDELPPGDGDELDDEDVTEIPDATTEGNWLDGHVGVAPKAAKAPKRNLFKEAGRLFQAAWGPHKPIGEAARIQAKSGNQVMVATVSPGLYIVQVVSDAAAKKIAGDNVGILPLVLYPLVKQKLQQRLAPTAPAQPEPAPAPATAAGLGCDGCPCNRGR